MADRKTDGRRARQGLPVPSGRISRLARFSGLGAGIVSNMVVDGAQRLARGQRPSLQDLLLTPSNAAKAADQLSRLRGAAMKFGQLVSMDAGEFVPPEFAEAMSRLRASAHEMPPRQLRTVLNENWGRDWLSRFESFDVRPVAAASIGQVHRAVTKDGRKLALKIQYPGVRDSIDSDIDNLASIIAVSGVVPQEIDIGPVLKEVKAQLKSEADYERESAWARRFQELLAGSDVFLVPDIHDDFTTRNILAMSYVAGAPIDTLASAPQDERDRAATALFDLALRELFAFRLMQTDPNFANFFVDKETGKIVLLDFGAARDIDPALAEGYQALLGASLRDDWPSAYATAKRMALVGGDMPAALEPLLRETVALTVEPMRCQGAYDFGATDLAARLRDKVFALRSSGFSHPPPPPAIFIHRKLGGLHLLATKLRARVDVGALVRPYLD